MATSKLITLFLHKLLRQPRCANAFRRGRKKTLPTFKRSTEIREEKSIAYFKAQSINAKKYTSKFYCIAAGYLLHRLFLQSAVACCL